MQQTSLFDPQRAHLQRVSSRIGLAILAFVHAHPRFHADDLRAFVESEVGRTAPGSCDRILRDLRRKGFVRYRVVSRRESLYAVE